jgi:hypothetical protein
MDTAREDTARDSTQQTAWKTESVHFLQTHRTWEDWVGIALSIAIILSPWMARQSSDPGVVMVSTLLGLMLLTLSQYELVKAHRSVELIELACGVVVMALPMLLGYAGAGQLRFWHFALGALVAALAVLELWQGWQNAEPTSQVQASSAPREPMHGDIH